MTMTPTTILLVEDDALLRDAIRLLLEEAGYRVQGAATGADALAAAEEHAPALVLLDLGLPDQSGLDVAREMRRRAGTRDTPIVALTGRVGPAERRACIEAGCSHYLAKPVQPSELLRQLPELIAGESED